MAKIREELSDAARAAAVRALDRNHDGVVNRADAAHLATMVEERWPLGIIIAFAAGGFILGLYVRGLFA